MVVRLRACDTDVVAGMTLYSSIILKKRTDVVGVDSTRQVVKCGTK